MPPETATARPDIRLEADTSASLGGWRAAVLALALSVLAIGLLTAREWGEMFHQWWDIDTYNHILLVPVIIAWLVWLRREELSQAEPRPWAPGLVLVALALGVWVMGRFTGVNIVAHAGAVGAFQGAAIAILGPRISLLLALPIAFAAFLVPFGDELIPALQAVTAAIAVELTHWSGVPATVDGIYIDTPAGLFIVAEACSGVKFLVAMVTLAVLVSFTRFDSWTRRGLFMAASIVVPIIANGIRAWGTIYVAQFYGLEFAAGFDHIFYGWIFFAIVVALLIGIAWRFFERDPEDYGWSLAQLGDWGWLGEIEKLRSSKNAIMALIAAMALAAALLAAIVAP